MVISIPRYRAAWPDPKGTLNVSLLDPEHAALASDGYHTFGELYDQRAHLLALATSLSQMTTYRSRLHDDGTMFPGMFWVCTHAPSLNPEYRERPVTFHIENRHWSLFDHAITMEKAPPWDGHTPADVMDTIRGWIAFLAPGGQFGVVNSTDGKDF